MICGTIVLEDVTLQWRLEQAEVQYTVQEGLQGYTATVICTDKAFAAALALAVGGDEISGWETLYPLAEKAMPRKEHLPAGYDIGVEETLRALRWIP